MKTIKIEAEFEYDAGMMHGDDPESVEWFRNILLGKIGTLTVVSDEIGDEIGTLKITKMQDQP